MARTPHSLGFPPLASSGCRVLILGTLPGPRSLETHEYYAHPRNAFWPIMGALLGTTANDYAGRARSLMANGIAVWDVLAAAARAGALDSRIERGNAAANDFTAFYRMHPGISTICFNGAEAARLYRLLVLPKLAAPLPVAAMHVLPSTSPTRTMALGQKLEAWAAVLRHVIVGKPA